MTAGVMVLDMLELRRVLERGYFPIQLSQPGVQVGVAGADIADIALEVLDIDGVEADYGRVEPDIGFGDGRAEVVGTFGVSGGEMGLCAVEGAKQCVHVAFISVLRRREARFVHAVIDLVIRPGVRLLDGGFQVCGE